MDGEPVLSAVAPVAGTGWRVLAMVPPAVVNARVWEEGRTIGLPGLGVLGVVTLVGFLIAMVV